MNEPMDPIELSKIISDTAGIELMDKFIRGQHEHGGDFAAKPTVRNIREEILDLVNYSHVLIKHRTQVLIELDSLITDLPVLSPSVVKMKLEVIRQQVHDL